MKREVETIWLHFHEELHRFITKKVGNEADAKDILQEVFLKILMNQNKVSQAQNLRSYLYGMVRNAVSDFYRKKVHTDHEVCESIPFSPAEKDTLNETLAECCLRPFIHELPEKYRQAVILSELEGMPQKDLADHLGISYSGAKSRVQRGREKLKDVILDCCDYESDRYGNIMGIRGEC